MNPEHFMHNYSKIGFSTAQETSRNGPLYGERDHTRPFAHGVPPSHKPPPQKTTPRENVLTPFEKIQSTKLLQQPLIHSQSFQKNLSSFKKISTP